MNNKLSLAEKLEKMPQRTPEREIELLRVEREAVINFHGVLDELESALGILRIGDYYGWRVLYIIHNKRTIKKYENILNISFKTFFPEEGSETYRSIGYDIAKKIGNFWKAVSGDIKIEERRVVTK